MNSTWQSVAETALGTRFDRLSSLGGGDFAASFKVTTTDKTVLFAKTHCNPPAGFFTTEATGLTWLRQIGAVNIPQVLSVSDEPPFLLLSWIDVGHGDSTTESSFGRQLAMLHAHAQSQFGRIDGATTGSLAVPNQLCDTWVEFYATQRLLPLVKIAGERGVLSTKDCTVLERIAARLGQFNVPDEPAALLHGDLWAGNRLVDQHGQSWLIDPAAHCGHREFELGMMNLFGGFGDDCFDAYNEVYPLVPGWRERLSLHQLAPLIVHAIKFGGSYVSAVRQMIVQYA